MYASKQGWLKVLNGGLDLYRFAASCLLLNVDLRRRAPAANTANTLPFSLQAVQMLCHKETGSAEQGRTGQGRAGQRLEGPEFSTCG